MGDDMRLVPTRLENGHWMNPIPYMITAYDLDTLIRDETERELVRKSLGKRVDNLCSGQGLVHVPGICTDPESMSRAGIVNGWFNRFNSAISLMRDNYFAWIKSGDMRAGEQLEYDFATREYSIPESAPQYAGKRESAPAPAPVPNSQETDPSLLLSTRRLLASLGVEWYDGPEFRFRSNRHPSPKESYIPTLAKEYMMQIIVPNALLASKHYRLFPVADAMAALDLCMTSGKSPESVDAWNRAKAGVAQSISEKYMFYVLGKTREGREVSLDHRCYFEKYLSLKVKDAGRFKKSKNQEVVAGLLARMENEPELKEMSRRKLVESGIPDRAARMFMEARKRR